VLNTLKIKINKLGKVDMKSYLCTPNTEIEGKREAEKGISIG